jgi:hypothetical protein
MKTTQLDDATVQERSNGSHVHYRINGTIDAVLKAIHALIVNYHPLGYGTRCDGIHMETSGAWTGEVSRLSSCD